MKHIAVLHASEDGLAMTRLDDPKELEEFLKDPAGYCGATHFWTEKELHAHQTTYDLANTEGNALVIEYHVLSLKERKVEFELEGRDL